MTKIEQMEKIHFTKNLTYYYWCDSITCELFTFYTILGWIMEKLNEKLLDSWLRLSTSVINSRIVSVLPYNEALVCNVLYKNMLANGNPLTATDLCDKTNMLKSQMNRTLNLLEEKGMIFRERSQSDKRCVYVVFNNEKVDVYNKMHDNILHFIDLIITELGANDTESASAVMTRIADIADSILKEKN